MSWNPYTRIADLERKVSEMHYELLQLASSNSARLRILETANPTAGLLTLEQTQALLDKRVRQNAAARRSYAKRKAEAQS